MNLPGKQLELTGTSLTGGSIDAKQYREKALLVIFLVELVQTMHGRPATNPGALQ